MGTQQDPGYYREQKNEQTGATGAKIAAGCGLGCLGIVLVVLVGIGIAIFTIQKKTDQFANQYVSDQPVLFEYPEIQMSEIGAIKQRFDKFLADQENQDSLEPLILSADDINILINHHETFQLLADRVKVDFIENRLLAEASIETDILQNLQIHIPFINKALKGKYLHGKAQVDLSVYKGKGTLFIRDFQLSKAQLPREILDHISSRNWLEHANLDPKLKELLQKIGELKIENDLLYFIPADPNAEPELDEQESKPQIIEA